MLKFIAVCTVHYEICKVKSLLLEVIYLNYFNFHIFQCNYLKSYGNKSETEALVSVFLFVFTLLYCV